MHFLACDVRVVCVTFLQGIFGVCMPIVRCTEYDTPIIKTIQHSMESCLLWIRRVRHRYAMPTFYTTNVCHIWNYKGHHGNATALKAYVAVTLHNCLVCLERTDNATSLEAYVAVTLYERLVREGTAAFFKQFEKLLHFRSSFDSPYMSYARRKNEFIAA